MQLTLKEIYKAIGKEEPKDDLVVKGISTDSRIPQRDSLFFAIKGERFDGHNFLWEAYKNGCISAVVQYIPPSPPPIHLIEVADTLWALGKIAAYYREKFNPICIGVTGSTGKTTTKEMLAHILRAKHNVLKSERNYNNEIGIPLTLFQLREHHSAVVLEMAMRGKGQIAWLAEISKPQIGIITNIGPAHLEFFQSISEIAEAKAELLRALPPDGYAILNMDNEFYPLLRSQAKCNILTFGLSPKADVTCEVLKREELYSLELRTPKGKGIVKAAIEAEHDIYNLLAAVCASICAGLSFEEISQQLPTIPRPPMRLELIQLPNHILLINDTYNSNPLSLKSALEYLKDKEGRRIAVLGDMLELGPESDRIHYEAGKWVKDARVDILITIGEKARHLKDGAIASGFSPDKAFSFSSRDEAFPYLRELLQEGDMVLVKASRKLELDKLVEELKRCYTF
ncbi:UDP-N-acetylmuramoyl-tripeptide--D-alanyl-D-alanine ligase [bacterium]|nr:UDP-N-acetylmuramoyl-tripeptide--D-alanyl-D-alanine ligase [bacterium]